MRTIFPGWLALSATVGLVGGAAAQHGGIQPGQWELTSTVTRVTGAPGPGGGRMPARTFRRCVTPQAAISGGRELVIAQGCTVKNFTYANGRIAAVSTCGPAGHAMTSTTTGTYTPTTFHTKSSSTLQGPMTMTMEGELQGRWVGACSAGK